MSDQEKMKKVFANIGKPFGEWVGNVTRLCTTLARRADAGEEERRLALMIKENAAQMFAAASSPQSSKNH